MFEVFLAFCISVAAGLTVHWLTRSKPLRSKRGRISVSTSSRNATQLYDKETVFLVVAVLMTLVLTVMLWDLFYQHWVTELQTTIFFVVNTEVVAILSALISALLLSTLASIAALILPMLILGCDPAELGFIAVFLIASPLMGLGAILAGLVQVETSTGQLEYIRVVVRPLVLIPMGLFSSFGGPWLVREMTR